MKKFLITLILTLILVQGMVYALTPSMVESQKDMNKGTVIQLEARKSAQNADYEAKVADLSNRYINNIKTCEQLHFSQSMDIFGLKLDFNIDINGWVNNKCNYALSGKIGGLGKDIKEVFELNLSDELLSKFEPKIECNFSKEDLKTMVEAFSARAAKNEVIVSQMLKPTEEKYSNKVPELTPEEEKMISILTGGNACRVLNKDELIKNFTEFMSSGDL